MPAIQPALLRQQAVLLAEHFDDPSAYKRSLHYLLDFYSDRSRHSGRAGTPPPIIAAYNVHPPVLRQIIQQLEPMVESNPLQGLALCDSLWDEPYLEFRLLAVMLLGKIPTEPPEPLEKRLNAWLIPDLEFDLIDAVMEHSLSRLRRERPKSIIRLIQDWLDQKDPFYKQLGLRALLPLIHQPDFSNLPVFFRLIRPLISHVPSGLRPDLLDVLTALAHRSPQETAFFLQQNLGLPDSPDTPWIIRQTIQEFPLEIQETLRQAEKSAGTQRRRP